MDIFKIKINLLILLKNNKNNQQKGEGKYGESYIKEIEKKNQNNKKPMGDQEWEGKKVKKG